MFRVEPDRLSLIGYGALVFALPKMRDAAPVKGIGIFGFESDRLGVFIDGAVEVPFLPKNVAAVEVGSRIGRIEFDRLRVILQRP